MCFATASYLKIYIKNVSVATKQQQYNNDNNNSSNNNNNNNNNGMIIMITLQINRQIKLHWTVINRIIRAYICRKELITS